LSWFDSLIENKKKQNETLEKTGMAIFKSWFINFEPFSDNEFVDSALGKMPKNWEIGSLSDVCEIIMGQSPPSEYYNREGEGSPFIQGKGQFGRYIPNTNVFCSTTGKKAKPKDILLTVRAPIGELNIADTDYIIGRGLASLRSENWVSIYFYLLSNKELLKASERGTTFDAITKPELESFPIIIPPQNVLEKFKALVEPLSRKIILNEKQISVLTKVRDALLPLLVFGKLRVEEI
jgi:type I restriction enzyme S subunit